MNKKEINQLVNLYFEHNPNMNKGLGFRAKANDIITSYATKHNMSFNDIKDCIEKNPMCQKPIWDQFYDYWFKKNHNNIEEKKSGYKNTINGSTNVDDWI